MLTRKDERLVTGAIQPERIGVKNKANGDLRAGARLKSVADGPLAVNVVLAAVNDADVADAERNDLAAYVMDGVRAAVHDVQLRNDSDGAPPVRIHLNNE